MSDREIEVLDKAVGLFVKTTESQHETEAEALRIAMQSLKLEHEFNKKQPPKKTTDWQKVSLWVISMLALVLAVIGKLLGLNIGGFLP